MAPSDSNQLHDLGTIHLDFKIILNLIKSGYRFDDSDAPAVIQQLEHALELLKNHINELERKN
jgi:hypothetical protein